MKKIILLAGAVSLFAAPLVVFGEHPNYDAGLSKILSNFTGIMPDELAKQFPQNRFFFSQELIGAFNGRLPEIAPIMTTRAPLVPFVPKDEPEVAKLPPIGPPVCTVNCTVKPPDHPPVCTHDCHEVPPVDKPTDVPEPKQWLFIAVTLLVLGGLKYKR